MSRQERVHTTAFCRIVLAGATHTVLAFNTPLKTNPPAAPPAALYQRKAALLRLRNALKRCTSLLCIPGTALGRNQGSSGSWTARYFSTSKNRQCDRILLFQE